MPTTPLGQLEFQSNDSNILGVGRIVSQEPLQLLSSGPHVSGSLATMPGVPRCPLLTSFGYQCDGFVYHLVTGSYLPPWLRVEVWLDGRTNAAFQW